MKKILLIQFPGTDCFYLGFIHFFIPFVMVYDDVFLNNGTKGTEATTYGPFLFIKNGIPEPYFSGLMIHECKHIIGWYIRTLKGQFSAITNEQRKVEEIKATNCQLKFLKKLISPEEYKKARKIISEFIVGDLVSRKFMPATESENFLKKIK